MGKDCKIHMSETKPKLKIKKISLDRIRTFPMEYMSSSVRFQSSAF